MRFLNPLFKKQNSVVSFLVDYVLSLSEVAGSGSRPQALAQEEAELSGLAAAVKHWLGLGSGFLSTCCVYSLVLTHPRDTLPAGELRSNLRK